MAEIPFMRVWHKRIINEAPATDSKGGVGFSGCRQWIMLLYSGELNASGWTGWEIDEQNRGAKKEKKKEKECDEAENNTPSPEVQISVSR